MSLYLRTDQSELHQFTAAYLPTPHPFIAASVFSVLLPERLIVIFTDRFIFQQSFYFIVRITADVTNNDTRACSASPRTVLRQIFTTFFGQRRQRNAICGTRRTDSKPRSDAMIAFQLGWPHGAVKHVNF